MTKNKTKLTIQSFHQMASLVSVKLSSANFLLWKSQVYPLIRSAQLIHHLEEEAPALTISKNGKEESNPEFENWLNNDGLLTSWLLGTMNEEALSVVVGCESTFQIWRCLEEHYLASTKEQELHLKGLLAVKRSDGESLEDFVRKFKNTCDQLAAIRKPLDDLDKVFQLSRVVGSRYQPYNLAVLSKAPYPTFNQYTTGLQNNERDLQAAEQENKDKTPVYAQTFVAHRGRGNRGRSYGGRYFNSRGRGFVQAGNYNWFGNQRTGNYNSFGNHKNFIANNNPLPQQNMPQKFQQQKRLTQQGENPCQICGISGHTALKCWYRFDHAYQSEELPQALATMTLLEKKDQNTYVDTGATDHMTSDAGKLYTKRPYTGNHKVFTGDGTPLDISHIGSASIGSLKLNNVLVVPNLKKNLLSVSKFTKENPCIFEFSSNGFVIKDQVTQAVLARGTKKGQLYALEEEQKHVLAAISNKATDSIWHQRLGHPNSSTLKTLVSKKSISISNWTKPSYLCTSCQMGKSCKLPFLRNNERAKSLFKKIHCDLWGPSPVQSINHFVYYVIFVDDYSRYTWFYPIHKKSDFFGVFLKFQKMISNQFNKTIKIFQCDGGGEFSSLAFVNHLAECGIKQQVSCPGTPEQNGVAERKHRHIVETGLTLLLHANMPSRYWVDSFSTAIFLINRMPTSVLNNKSPYYLLYGKVPDYSMLKVFGCRCFPYLRDYAAHKLQPRSLPCVFLGYSPIHKGYKCLHPSTQRIYISRHVIFDEHFMPYTDLTNISKHVAIDGEFCKYPDCDEWLQVSSHLQPSKHFDEHLQISRPIPRCTTISDERENTHYNQINTTIGESVVQQLEEGNATQQQLSTQEVTQINNEGEGSRFLQDVESPGHIDESQSVESSSHTNVSSSSEDIMQHRLDEEPAEHQLIGESENSSLNRSGVSPPPHNATSISNHPMITRARAGTHTGHVKTIFTKHANYMNTNDSSFDIADHDIQEPKTVKKALQIPHWFNAMREELDALHKNNTWTLVPPPSSPTNIVGSKWVFKTKLNPDGTVERFKARLVA
ncbi:hypothetical protein SLA2020_200620 [Shorea laevis]